MVSELAARAESIRAAVAAAAIRGGRAADAVAIIAVTKTFPPATVAAAVAAGFHDVGENYVQEGRAKRVAAGTGGDVRWHLIGGLQRNKVRHAVAAFDRIHTVDSLELATSIAAEALRAGRRMPVLLQVNVAHDDAKRGTTPDDAATLARAVLALDGVALDGLMTIGPRDDAPDAARTHFAALRALRDDLAQRLGVELPHLSMGMSGDFAIAIEEGATFVRLGRALLGERQGGPWREGA